MGFLTTLGLLALSGFSLVFGEQMCGELSPSDWAAGRALSSADLAPLSAANLTRWVEGKAAFEAAQSARSRVYSSKVVPWEGGEVPYEISCNVNDYTRQLLARAMTEISSTVPCIRFRGRRPGDAAWISVKTGDPCNCCGMHGRDPQLTSHLLNLNWEAGCGHYHIVLHELLHTLGAIHEHKRPDRDDFLWVDYSNILDHRQFQFQKHSWADINAGPNCAPNKVDPACAQKWYTTQGTDLTYEYASIMHYGVDFDAKDKSKNTMTPLHLPQNQWATIGAPKEKMTYIDGRKLQYAYNCY